MILSAPQLRTRLAWPSDGKTLSARFASTDMEAVSTLSSKPTSSIVSPIRQVPSGICRMMFETYGMKGASLLVTRI